MIVCETDELVHLCSLANSVSAGQLLCSGLFSSDGLSTWFASVALLHAIVENSTQKEQLLRVQLATSLGHPPVSLLQQCTNILTQVTKRVFIASSSPISYMNYELLLQYPGCVMVKSVFCSSGGRRFHSWLFHC